MRVFVATVFLLIIQVAVATDAAGPAGIPIDTFAQLPQMSGVEVSPDGSHIAYIRPREGRTYLAIERLRPDSSVVLVAPLETLTFDWVRWANNDRLVFLMSYFGQHRATEVTETRLFAVDKSGENVAPIILPGLFKRTGSRLAKEHQAPHDQGKIVDWLNEDHDHILVAVDDDHDAEYGVRKVDIRSGKYEEVRADHGGIQEWMSAGGGELRLGYGYRSHRYSMRDGDFVATYLDDKDVWRETTNPRWYQLDYEPVAATDERAVFLMLGTADSGLQAVREVNVETDEPGDVILADGQADVVQVFIDRGRNRFVGAGFAGDRMRSTYIEDSMSLLQRSVDRLLPDRSNLIASFSKDRRRVIVFSSSDIVPGEYYYWDRDSKSFDLIDGTMPGLPGELLAPVMSKRYEARDGLAIQAYLTVPKGQDAKDLPVVVLLHGGPESRDAKRFNFMGQFLASRGYAVFQPNFRGSSGYGRAFQRAGHRQWGGKMQDDVTDGTKWLIAEGIADPQRICIAGMDYGGYAAVIGLVQTPDLYQCAASINGIMNLPRQIEDYSHYIGSDTYIETMGLMGKPAKEVSPFHLVDAIQAPVLLIQSRDDVEVPLNQGRDMYQRMSSLDKRVAYVELEWGGHDLSNQPARAQVLASLEDFLKGIIGSDR